MLNQLPKKSFINRSCKVFFVGIPMLCGGCFDQSPDELELFNDDVIAKKTSNGFFLFKDGEPMFRYIDGTSSGIYEIYSNSGPVVDVEIKHGAEFPARLSRVVEVDGAFFLIKYDPEGEIEKKLPIDWEVEK